PLTKAVVEGEAWRESIESDRPSPVLPDRVEHLFLLFHRAPPWVVRSKLPPGEGADCDQRRGSCGVRRGEEHAHHTPLGTAAEGGAPRADCIHPRPHVVHPRLEVGQAGQAVREPRTTLVEKNESREGCQPSQESRNDGLVPENLDVRYPTRHKDEIAWSIADDLIGDIDVARHCVARFRGHGKGASERKLSFTRARQTQQKE